VDPAPAPAARSIAIDPAAGRSPSRWRWPLAVVAYALPMGVALATWRSPQAALAPLFGPWAKALYRGDAWIWTPMGGRVVIALTVLGPLALGLAVFRRARWTRVVLATWWAVWVLCMLSVLAYTQS